MKSRAYPFRIGGPAAASLLVNALLIAALLNLGMGRASRRTDAPSLTVLSLAVLKGVEDGKEEAETAAPSPPVSAPASLAEPVVDQPSPSAMQLAIPPAVAIPSAMPQPIQVTLAAGTIASTPASAPAAASAPRAALAAAPPARRGMADGLDANAPPGTSRSYAAKIRSWLYAHKIYPRRARMRREEGKVQVRFVIDRGGVLIEGVIVHGSGNGALDEEAVAMMQRASPFPKAPNDVLGERIEFIAPIEFILPV